LLAVEALIVWLSFVVGTTLENQENWWLLLNVEGGYLKILGLTGIVLLFSHWLDLYDMSVLGAKWDQIFRILLVLGFVAIGLSAVGFLFPQFLPGNGSLLTGIVILTFMLFLWRIAYGWILQQPYFRERVYILGTGDRAQRLLNGLRERRGLGIDVVGWTGNLEGAPLLETDESHFVATAPETKVNHLLYESRGSRLVTPVQEPGPLTRELVAAHLVTVVQQRRAHRVILAMSDRRGTLPVEELLALRLSGVKVEESTSWLEKITGRIEVEQLYPSWLIFAEGFRFSAFNRMLRRIANLSVALIGLIFAFPVIPIVVLAVKLSSPGPVLYRQKRIGRGGRVFYCYKFRTMRQDAEADTGATWATDNDPRITRVGKFLRSSRLDEIPQLWCVLQGDMHFVGPRPERPEFVEWLSKEIPYYGVRHTVRPGITGWAQVQYKYGNTLEDAREKLQHDLFYIKNASLGLDFWIVFQTVKIVLLGRGAK